MFSLIITIISIALVAALAIATVYYGSDAFNQGSSKAQASTLINAGQQVNGAVAIASNDQKTFSTVEDLVTQGYLNGVPAKPGSVSGAWTLAANDVTVTGVPDEVCAKVNAQAGMAESSTAENTNAPYYCDAGTFTFKL